MQTLRLVLLFLGISCLCILPHSHAQDRAPYLKWAVKDASELLGGIDGKTLLYGAGGIGIVSLLSTLDEPIRNRAANSGQFIQSYADVTNLLGEPYVVIPGALGIFGISLLTENTRFQDAAFTSLEALAYASAVTIGLKMLIGRHRPNRTSSAYTFSPLSGNDSFPSGHATAAFAVLVPWALYYPNVLTWSLVGITAGSTAFARIEKNKHWFSDVLAGSVIGFTGAYLLSRKHQHKRAAQLDNTSSLRFTPLLFPNHQGMLLEYSF